jgi:hypothetical protein
MQPPLSSRVCYASETDFLMKEQGMHRLLLVSAASLIATIAALPAQAADRPSVVSVGVSGNHARSEFRCDVGRDRRDGRRDRRSRGDCTFIGGNLGYLDYGDYDANRGFDPDAWNDWWHERPSRAYPRWVQDAQARGSCAPERMWWSGSGWHC